MVKRNYKLAFLATVGMSVTCVCLLYISDSIYVPHLFSRLSQLSTLGFQNGHQKVNKTFPKTEQKVNQIVTKTEQKVTKAVPKPEQKVTKAVPKTEQKVSKVVPKPQQKVTKTVPKTILWYFTPRYLPTNLTSRVPVSACPEAQCFQTRNRSLLESSDAVIFNSQYIKGPPPPRKPGQVWIFHNNEPPYLMAYDRDYYKQPWSSAFNWTMSFRHDSDIFRPYGLLRKRITVPVKNYTAIVKKKTKLVAWMISNCLDWSKRLAYGKELQKHIPVDIYGLCGKMTFRREQNNDWLQYLNETYKFYLGFENNYCKDYISEKFFNNFNLDLVTVVRGGGNYSRDAPPGTYINVDDFKSPKHLAEHLWYLHNNTDKYVEILKRKEEYYYQAEEYLYIDPGGHLFSETYYEHEALCDICRRLNNIENHTKTIADIVPWWKSGLCKNPTKPF